jgi:hypothetical protein
VLMSCKIKCGNGSAPLLVVLHLALEKASLHAER